MSQYRMLADHFIGGQVLPAGSIQSTADVGGTLPVGWVPSLQSEPMDSGAVAAFWSRGPGLCGHIDNGFKTWPPVTYWKKLSNGTWQLTGLGSSLGPVGGG